jgi:hypothetical protein
MMRRWSGVSVVVEGFPLLLLLLLLLLLQVRAC